MLTDYFEHFTLVERCIRSDGMGGEQVSWQDTNCFLGVLTHTTAREISVGGRAILHAAPTLLHEFDVTLTLGDYVRRSRDGSLWRVCGNSDGMRTPALSGLQFAQVPVERLVIPC